MSTTEKLAETRPRAFVFVLMPFGPEFKDVYKVGIKAACEQAGVYCERLDEQIFDESMLQRIYNQIHKADIIVADMSKRNPNVFYEVGYAHALGKRVVLITDDAADIPFDLKHYFHVEYGNSISTLVEKLVPRLRWYAEHPNERVGAETTGLQFFVNGVPLGEKTTVLDVTTQRDDYRHSKFRAARLDIAVHNPTDRTIQDVSFSPILITPPCFPKAILYEPGRVTEYSSIRMPTGSFVHRPFGSCHLEPGAWDTIPFNLILEEGYVPTDDDVTLTLRVLSYGPPWDLEFHAIIHWDQAK